MTDMIRGLKADWHIICPNLKKDIVDEGGKAIADPFLVLRGSIWTEEVLGIPLETDPLTLGDGVLTPPITGRLDRVKIGPVASNAPPPPYPPGPLGVFSIVITQYDSDAWNSFNYNYPPGNEYPGIDLLNGLGVNIPNNTVTEITEDNIPGAFSPLIPMLLVEDRLLIGITDWGDGVTSPPPNRLLNIYLYFRADKSVPADYLIIS